ncbi:hypothetical protein [Arthronema virus TR020]|uniref:Uncharacterized protein n=1 Tax=Arthronema virus TR020 TaxID=2736280 RepID=A0A7G3WH39_9CAUD|nr:hypothetical protein [Arthronema virus TR020]
MIRLTFLVSGKLHEYVTTPEEFGRMLDTLRYDTIKFMNDEKEVTTYLELSDMRDLHVEIVPANAAEAIRVTSWKV